VHNRNPFYVFFTCLLFGALFLVTGVIGWKFVKGSGAFAGGYWVDGPVWPQVAWGTALLVVAAVAYRFASRDPRLR
jgi:hypothetical protein